MRQRLDIGEVDGKAGVEAVGVPDALRLGGQLKQLGVGVEGPLARPPGEAQPTLVGAKQHHVAERAALPAVRSPHGVFTNPLNREQRDGPIDNSVDDHPRAEVLKREHRAVSLRALYACRRRAGGRRTAYSHPANRREAT